ncbi:MAG: type II secretion system protein [Candidatus Gracilibacteria bacterium]|nr:type II secretion system protein [Candidatus Gracilibacteria bacterium]
MKRNAFTLVELIVIVTILVILGTVGFVGYSGYLSGVRDANRESQLKVLSDSISLYALNKPVPLPEENVSVLYSGSVISYQGYLGSDIIDAIGYTEEGIDPKTKDYFTYYVTADRKYYQLLTFLENRKVANTNTNFQVKFPHTVGDKLGIFIGDVEGTNSNIPLQEIITPGSNIELENVSMSLTSILSETDAITGDHTVLEALSDVILSGGKGYSVSSTGQLIYTDYNNL